MLPHFVVESGAEIREGLMEEDSPHDAVVEREVSPLELGDAVVTSAVLHVEEPEVWQYPDEDGLRVLCQVRVEGSCRQSCHQPADVSLEVGAHHVLLSGVYLEDAFPECVVDKLFPDE